jgi:hypothetical protein
MEEIGVESAAFPTAAGAASAGAGGDGTSRTAPPHPLTVADADA